MNTPLIWQEDRKRVAAVYDAMAKSYDNFESDAFYSNQYRAYGRALADFSRHLSGNILDLGCGTGLQTKFLAELGCSVWGVDVSPGLLAAARQSCAGLRGVQLIEADARSLPFARCSFDAVVSLGEVLSHLHDPVVGFAEATRVLKPGGTFLFSVLNKWNVRLLRKPAEFCRAITTNNGHWRKWHCVDDQGQRTVLELKCFTRKEIEDIGKSCGFRLVGARGIHVSSLLLPLAMQEHVGFFNWLFRKLGRFDSSITGCYPFTNLGYTTIYTALKD